VVVHELFGVNDIVRRQTDRLAAAGYLALAPDLLSDGRRCVVRAVRAALTGEGASIADIDAARETLSGREDCTGRIGIVGFCMGGAFALVTANRGFAASAVNYGQLPKDLDGALAGACPIVANYGGRDLSLRGAAGKLDSALTRLGVEHDVREFPSAGHSFLNDRYFGPSASHPVQRVAGVGPDPRSAPEAWRRIEEFLHAHLRG
jgi:carboxymethylenebutenolidase